jgi:hypothetical protein
MLMEGQSVMVARLKGKQVGVERKDKGSFYESRV